MATVFEMPYVSNIIDSLLRFSFSRVARIITEPHAKFQVVCINQSFSDMAILWGSPSKSLLFPHHANQWFSEIQHSILSEVSNLSAWKTISVTFCGSFYPQNKFQGCQLVHFGSVFIISVVLTSYTEQILRQLSAQCAFNISSLMAGRGGGGERDRDWETYREGCGVSNRGTVYHRMN